MIKATTETVKIKWFVYSGGEKSRRNSTMRGYVAYDAECSCGWESNTGGAVKNDVEYKVFWHKINEHNYTILRTDFEGNN